MKTFLKSSLAAALAMSLTLTLSAQAADKKAKGEAAAEGKAKAEGKAEAPGQAAKAGRALPYGGTLTAKTADSITVKKKEATKTFAVTSTTKIVKDGKPATLADGTVGEAVGVSYVEADGKAEAKSVRFGAVPAKPEVKKKAGE